LIRDAARFAEFGWGWGWAKAVAECAVAAPVFVHPAVAVRLDPAGFEQMDVESVQDRHRNVLQLPMADLEMMSADTLVE
jgi:hypothetical protein